MVAALLRRPPEELATWALDQVNELSRPGADLEQSQLFKLAGTLQAAPPEQKQALVKSAMAGFRELPPARKAEVVRVAMQTSSVMQRQEQRRQQRQQQAAASGDVAPRPRLVREGSQSDEEQPLMSDLAVNLGRLAQEAKFDTMSPEEVKSMQQAVQEEVVKMAQPQQLLDVVAQLDEGDREHLSEALVEARVIPEDRRPFLEEAVRPGGYADKLIEALHYVAVARKYAWIAIVMPLVEFIISGVLGLAAGDSILITWLRMDALLALVVAGTGYCCAVTLAPVYRELQEDPMGVMQRFQVDDPHEGLNEKVAKALPGVEAETWRNGGILACVSLLGIALGAVWAVIGIPEFLAALAFGTNGGVLLVSLVFIGARLGIIVAVVMLLYHVMDETLALRSRSHWRPSETPRAGDGSRPCQIYDAVPVDPNIAADSRWELVFRQRNAKFPSGEWSKNAKDPTADLYARLDQLEQYRGPDGRLTFKMVFPNRRERPNFNIWKQATNPVTMAAGDEVTGFQPVQIAYDSDNDHDGAFGGLQKSRVQFVLLHNYDAHYPHRWFYAIGRLDDVRWPGADGDYQETWTELYVMPPAASRPGAARPARK